MPEQCRQFVILHHVLSDSDHWDLMLEVGEALATWQLASDPVVLTATHCREAISARRISDHRRSYLEYEGPVSRGRGHVKRFDDGSYELMRVDADSWTIRLEGRQLRGVFAVTSTDPQVEGVFQRLE